MKEQYRETEQPEKKEQERLRESDRSGETRENGAGEEMIGRSYGEYKSAPEMTEYGRKVAENTKQNLMNRYGEQMGEKNLNRLEAHDTRAKIEVLDYRDFHNKFPDASPYVIGRYHNDTVYAVNDSQDKVNHIVTHETTHLCSHKETSFQENEDGSRQSLYASGIFRVETTIDPEGNRHVSVSNRAMNEGLTEMYTLRELNSRGDWQAANSCNCYGPQRGFCAKLEGILDPGTLEDAYYGGKLDGLKGNMERLTGDPGTFDRISENLSALDNPDKADEARAALENDYMAMAEARFAELSAENETAGFSPTSGETGGEAADGGISIGGLGGETGGNAGGDFGSSGGEIGGDTGDAGDTGGRNDADDSGDTGGNDDDE